MRNLISQANRVFEPTYSMIIIKLQIFDNHTLFGVHSYPLKEIFTDLIYKKL